ncbi:MAG: glycosyltransferase family 9 protein [Bacteroidetes bacterium]|nr:glycosyltransferase family 9 protein [Bacteroidota bacterium]
MPRYLIIQTASIGDVILATSLLEKLHLHDNNAFIDIMVKKGIESLFLSHPFIHKVYIWDKNSRKIRNLIEILRTTRKERYDYVINVQRFMLTGFFTVLTGAKHTRGFRKNPLSVFFGKRYSHDIGRKGIHEIQRNHQLISDITGEGPGPVRLYPSKADDAKVSQYKTHSYICIAPASLWFTKQYPAEKWVDFLNQLDHNYYVYFLGSPGDKKLCDDIIERSGYPNCLNLAGKLSLLETAALMREATMNYVNDSAPQHLASAVNARTTAVFCSTVPAFGFGPLSDDAVVVETDKVLKCRPCGLHGYRECPEGHFDCAYTVETDKLIRRLG